MTDLTHTLFPNYVVDTESGQSDGTGENFRYSVTDKKRGDKFDTPFIQVSPDELQTPDGLSVLGAVLQSAQRGPSVQPHEGVILETVIPALTRTPTNTVGSPADLANALIAGVVDAPINLGDWALGGFEGEIPSKRYLSSDPRDVVGGSEQLARGLEAVGDVAREGIAATERAGLNVAVPEYIPFLGGSKVGAKTLLDPFAFDTSPKEGRKRDKYISLITQMFGGSPVDASLIAKLATQLAKTTSSATSQHVYEALSEMQLNNPLRAAATEAAMGAAAGAGMVTSLETLLEVYPDAPQWMQDITMAGGGLFLPMVGSTVGSTVYDVVLKTPIVSIPLRVLRGATESLTLSGAEKAATRAIQTMGSDWRNRADILDVTGQLRFALAQGRDIDPVTRIAFTTPQLARNEARLMESRLNSAADDMSPENVAAERQKIEDLRRFANFQEGQLKTLSSGGKVGAAAYAKYSERMMDRRDSIMAALDDAILKLDLGGKSDSGVSDAALRADWERNQGTTDWEYNSNRLRGVLEGLLPIDSKQTQAISQAYENFESKMDLGRQEALADAEQRVAAIRDSMPEKMSDQDRADFNLWIRRELDTAYKEIDTYEDILWNSIKGMDRPKTESYVSPDGMDLGPQLLIDGAPIGEYFAAKVAALKAGEHENQSKYLWKLAGRNAIVEQATKGGGPDAEKIARQNVALKEQEAIVAERQRRVDVAAEKVRKLRENAEDGAENPALLRAQDSFETAQGKLIDSQNRLNRVTDDLEISLSKGVTHEGNPVDLAKEITDGSILGVRMEDNVAVGRQGQEIQNIISHLKQEMRAEGRLGGSPAKLSAIGNLIDDLQRAIPENFPVNTVALDSARKMTAAKHALFSKGTVGRLLGFTATGETKVPIDRTLEKIAPQTAQATNLRELQTALTRVASGEGTPFRIVTKEDGTTGPELDPDFNLARWAEGPPPPFESIQVEGGRSLGLKVSEDTPITDANIKMVEDTLWDRFRAFDSGTEFDTKNAARWIERNGPAIRWLKRATGKNTGFEDLTSAERIVQSIKGADLRNLDLTIETLRKGGAFKYDPQRGPDDQFTEQGFKDLVRETARRESRLKSAATILDEPDALMMGDRFIAKFMNDPKILDETLKILENGVLPNGNNPALEGFKQAVAESLLGKALTSARSTSDAAKQAKQLSDNIGAEVRLWDPEALAGLAQDRRVRKLLGDLYGEAAPEMLRMIADGARLQTAIGASATPNVRVQDAISDEWAANFGRMTGGWVAQYLPISGLVMTGIGRRYGMNAIANVRGSAIDRLIVDFLMDPKLAAAAIEKYPQLTSAQKGGMRDRARIWAHQKFIGDNARRIQRLGRTPGTLYEIGEPTKYQELDDEEGPQAYLRPLSAPVRQVATAIPARPPLAASALSQVNPVGPAPMAQGPIAQGTMAQGPIAQGTMAQGSATMAQGTMERGQQLFGANDIVFSAAHGGYADKNSGIMSIKCKPQQIVG